MLEIRSSKYLDTKTEQDLTSNILISPKLY